MDNELKRAMRLGILQARLKSLEEEIPLLREQIESLSKPEHSPVTVHPLAEFVPEDWATRKRLLEDKYYQMSDSERDTYIESFKS